MAKSFFAVCYGYARVSTGKQVEFGLSLQAQKEAHKRYYQLRLEHDGVLWGDTFVDSEAANGRKGVSGKTRFIERPAGRKLWMRLEPGDHVVITRLDRAFRSFLDAVNTFEAWMTKGIFIHVISQAIDTSTEGGKLMARVLAAVAEFERTIAAERTREAMKHRKKRGGVMNQYAGYGRRLDGQRGHRRVADDPNELKVMEAICEMHDDRNMSFDEIYLVLLKSNIRTRRDKAWSRARTYRAYLNWKSRSASSPSTPPTTNGQPS